MSQAKALSEAVWNGDLDGVKQLIAQGADVNEADHPRQPPLHIAIEQMETEIAAALIAAGADVNRVIENNWTPIAHAVDIESDAAVQAGLHPDQITTHLTSLLLLSGATPTKEAIEMARRYGNYKAVTLMESARQSEH